LSFSSTYDLCKQGARASSGESPLEIRKLKPGFDTLGVVTDFLAKEPPYANLRAGDLLAAVTYQLSLGHHVAGFENKRLVAYCGWLATSKARGEAWLQSNGRLDPIPPPAADAAALTVVKVPNPAHVLPMIRACRDRNKGKRIFFKRDYLAPNRKSRKAAVINRTVKKKPGTMPGP
jgi:hypothetical protein